VLVERPRNCEGAARAARSGSAATTITIAAAREAARSVCDGCDAFFAAPVLRLSTGFVRDAHHAAGLVVGPRDGNSAVSRRREGGRIVVEMFGLIVRRR
jgi:hypothetical protein